MKIKKHVFLFIPIIITSLTINSLFCAEQKEEFQLIEENPTEQIEAPEEPFLAEETETPQKKPSWFQRFISKPAVKYTAFALTTGLILYTGAINMGYANSPMTLWKQYFAPQQPVQPPQGPGQPQPQPQPGQQPGTGQPQPGPQLPSVTLLDPKSAEILEFQLNSKINELQTLQNKVLAQQGQQGQQQQQQQQQFQEEQQKQIFENAKVKNLQQKPNFDEKAYNIPEEGQNILREKLKPLREAYERGSAKISIETFNRRINDAINRTRIDLSKEELAIGMKKQVKSTIDKKDLDLATKIPELFKFEYHQKEFTEIPTIRDNAKKNTRIGWVSSVFNVAKKEYEKEYQKVQNDIPSLIQLNEKTLEKINKIIEDNNLPY